MSTKETYPPTHEQDTHLRITERGKKVASIGLIGASIAGGAAAHQGFEAIKEYNQSNTVMEEVIPVSEYGLIDSTVDKVTVYLEENNVDVEAKLPYGQITMEAQDAVQKYRELTGNESVQPDALFNVTLGLSDAGNYSVEIDPLVYANDDSGPLQVEP